MDYIIREDGTVWRKSTLAHALDKRNVSYGEPSAMNLPETVNPYKIISALFGNHLCTIQIKNEDESLIHCLPLLSTFVPAGDAVMVFRELPKIDDIFIRSNITETVTVSKSIVVSDTVSRSKVNG